MNDQLINQRLSSLDPEYRSFVESEFVTNVAQVFAEELGVTGRSVEVLENTFFLYLLSLLTFENAAGFIRNGCNISEEDAEDILYAFEAGLPENLPKLLREEHEKMFPETPQSLASEIEEAEKTLDSIEGIRTMAGDMAIAKEHSVPVYQSSQDQLLARQSMPTPIPTEPPTSTPIAPQTPAPPSGPQWGTG